MKRLLLLTLGLVLAGCGAPQYPLRAIVQEWADYLQQDHALVPGDVLTISVWEFPDLTQEVTVTPTGTVNLKRIAEPVRAVGLTMARFRKSVEDLYKPLVANAEVSVTLKTPSVQTVFVMGEVTRPGVIPWTSNMTLARAVAAAGGFEITAKTSDVLVVRAERNGAPRTIRVNLNDILDGGSVDFLLLPGDVVHAQTSAVADAGNFVELYIRRLLPFSITGVSLGTRE
jgi:polysaccharide export outer membrane protein